MLVVGLTARRPPPDAMMASANLKLKFIYSQRSYVENSMAKTKNWKIEILVAF